MTVEELQVGTDIFAGRNAVSSSSPQK